MLRTTLSISPLLVAAASFLMPSSAPAPAAPAAAQERVAKKEAKDFPALLTSARAAWDAGQYGKASAELKEASKLVAMKQREGILAAFPAAPEGWTFTPSEVEEGAVMLMGMTGLTVEGRYQGPSNEHASMTVMVDSPMVQMMSMMFANPAMLGDDAEVIKYGKHQAILQKNGDKRYDLQLLIGNDFIQVESREMTDEALLGLCNQAMVDKLEAAMKN
ncbi:hypothetical protein Poly30_53190 [Planctomycetes bacterium Poly30]|uniref:Uncharacterized protein n=1 Tax=Saltatorellus ferox TaxID=2528018 RepID=A0A518F0B1_9BACT|nr:hypothetical protein Poly30_53190 [Planctomycetes bacterium Poly30]